MKVLRLRLGAIALVSLAAAPACSSTHAPAAPAGNIVTVTTGSPPALIAYRDDASVDWIGLPVQGATTFDLTTHGAYQVVVACSAGDSDPNVSIVLYGRTPDDDPSIESTCGATSPFDVRGTVLEPGEVALGDAREGASFADWGFDLPARPGTFDLVLLSRDSMGVPSGIAFRRDIAIVNDKDLGRIDLTQEVRQALVPVSFTIANLQPGEAASSTLLLDAGNTRALVSSLGGPPPGLTAQLAPDSELRPTDSQQVTLSAFITDPATSLTHSRALGRDVRVGDPTSWTLPDPLGAVTFDMTADRLTATWSMLPDHDRIELLRASFAFEPSIHTRVHEMILSRSYLEATGATSATLDFHAIPGFKSQWQQDPTATQFRELDAIHDVSVTETASATVSGSVSSTSAASGARPAAEPGAEPATWFAPGGSDRWLSIPRRSPRGRSLVGRP